MNGRTIRGGKQYVTQKEQQRYNAYLYLRKGISKSETVKTEISTE